MDYPYINHGLTIYRWFTQLPDGCFGSESPYFRHWDSHGPSGAVLPGLVVLCWNTLITKMSKDVSMLSMLSMLSLLWIFLQISPQYHEQLAFPERILTIVAFPQPWTLLSLRQIDFSGKHITRPWPLCAFWTVFVFKRHRESKWWYKNDSFWSNRFLSK